MLDDSHRAVQALRRKWFKISAFVHAEDCEAQMKSSTDTFKLTAPKLLELTSPTERREAIPTPSLLTAKHGSPGLPPECPP